MARFLFPEDEGIIRELCWLMVTACGHHCDLAADGQEGGTMAERLEYDAIVSDGQMPRCDGPAMLQRLGPRTEGRTPTALKTATAYDERIITALGVGWMLGKPFGVDELQDLCSAMLRARVEALLARESARTPDPDAPAAPVDLPLLAHALRLQAGGRPILQATPRGRVFRASSPAAAVRALALAVHDWRPVAEAACRVEAAEPAVHEAWLASMDIVAAGEERLRLAAPSVPDPLRTHFLLALACARHGWRWSLGEDVRLEVDAPVHVSRDGPWLDARDGPAVIYPDGWAVHVVRGIVVDPAVVEDPRAQPELVVAETPGALGRERIAREIQVRQKAAEARKLIHMDAVPVEIPDTTGRTITRALIEEPGGHRFLVATDGSSGRVYRMRVPDHCETCEEAAYQLSGRPGRRTIVQA